MTITMEQKRKAVVGIYSNFGCMSSTQASGFIKRKMGLDIPAASIARIMKAYETKGYAASSKNEKNTIIYWLQVPAWEIKEDENE